MADVEATRGSGVTLFRDVRCKDCLREQLIDTGDDSAAVDEAGTRFEYSEAWATKMLDRGGSRTDRCARHRREHRQAIQGIAVAYVDLTTIGEVADRSNPTGPLGGLGELPATHRPKPVSVDLSKHEFGMTDDDIRKVLRKLGNDKTRVLVLKAGTGTGKSTFCPLRLMNPPTDQEGDRELLQLTKLGPIIVTEPRVEATTGVAGYVGEKLVAGCAWKVCSQHGRFVPAEDADPENPEGPDHDGLIDDDCIITGCSDHIGPGYPVGYQVKGDRKHDDSCQLIYVTDGSMVNWLRDGRLSKIGAVIVDEAHERSVNIDFIMGELKRQLDRYPHLRVIITSATFDVPFYVDFFGGPEVVDWMNVPATKAFGYGAPFFPLAPGARGGHDAARPCVCDPVRTDGPCHVDGDPTSFDEWVKAHWNKQDAADLEKHGDLRSLTARLERLRYKGELCENLEQWRNHMPAALVEQVVHMVRELDAMGIGGDILSFLPTEKLINDAVAKIQAAIGDSPTDVFGLIGSMSKELRTEVLAARPPGARRKVVVATNLAETSLTVKGVRFVVDTGIITQSTWDPKTASGKVPTGPHSQAGVRQRWGRVGRDAPGWVFPLYTVQQFRLLAQATPPGSTRENLEKLIMTAKAGGVDHLDDFDWPASWEFGEPDQSAIDARDTFIAELKRASRALQVNGIVDDEGHLTTFGKEVQRFAVVGASPGQALATMYADQLACVPEVASALALLSTPLSSELIGKGKLFLDDPAWSPLDRAQAVLRRQTLSNGCQDDLDLALRISAGWDGADPERAPWEATARRRRWCAHWWLNPAVLLKAAEARHETLAALSPAMKEEVKRHVDPRLSERARAVLSRSMTSLQYRRETDDNYVSVVDAALPPARIANRSMIPDRPEQLIALSRDRKDGAAGEVIYLQNLVRVLPWATEEQGVFELLARAASKAASVAPAGVDPFITLTRDWPVGMRFRAKLGPADATGLRSFEVTETLSPLMPPGMALPEEDGGTSAPTSSEGSWLLGTPLPDEELLAHQAVDTADDPGDPERGTETNDDESVASFITTGPVENLLARAPLHSQTGLTAIVEGECTAAEMDGTFACIGYQVGDNGPVSVRLARELFAVSVEVPDDRIGRVKGTRGRNLEENRRVPGILACELDRAGILIMLATSAAAIKQVLAKIDPASRATGILRMPFGANPLALMGKGANIRKQLQELSGCTWAKLREADLEWDLAGPTSESVLRFFDLAAARVPGCTGELTSPSAMAVTDLVAKEAFETWLDAELVGCSIDEWPHLVAAQRPDDLALPPEDLQADGSSQPSTVAADALDGQLRTIRDSLRRDMFARADLEGLEANDRGCLTAFCFGLAHSALGGSCEWQGATSIMVRWPEPPAPQLVSLDGAFHDMAVSGFDGSVEAAARMLRLGRTVRLDLSATSQDELNDVRYYLAGLASALGLKMMPGAPGQLIITRP